MSKKLMAAALVLGVSMLPVAAIAGGWGGGGGGGSGSSDGDWALRDELKNPRLIQPGSPYGYDRHYARGPAPWPFPPAYQAGWAQGLSPKGKGQFSYANLQSLRASTARRPSQCPLWRLRHKAEGPRGPAASGSPQGLSEGSLPIQLAAVCAEWLFAV